MSRGCTQEEKRISAWFTLKTKTSLLLLYYFFFFSFFLKLLNFAAELVRIIRNLHVFLRVCKLWEPERFKMKICKGREQRSATWKYPKEDKLATVLAISIVYDVQQLQFSLMLKNEQSWVILKTSLKFANCMKSFNQIWNVLTSISSLLTNYTQLATTASANQFLKIFFWIWKQNAGRKLEKKT